jgi:hypothetical protein
MNAARLGKRLLDEEVRPHVVPRAPWTTEECIRACEAK